MKTGIIGGTFDPIHNGHITVAEAVRANLDLAEVIFVPAKKVSLREDTPVATAGQRLAMVRLAVADKPCFSVSTVDLERPGPTRTLDTLTDLRVRLGKEAELYFIIGQDILGELPQWWQPERLIELCHLVVVPRPDYPAPGVGSLESAIPGILPRLVLLDGPRVDISATAIRERVRQGQSVSDLVPAPVADYIKKYRLYLG